MKGHVESWDMFNFQDYYYCDMLKVFIYTELLSAEGLFLHHLV